MKTLLIAMMLSGCSVTPGAKPQPDPQCVQTCEDARTFCLGAYTAFCRASCGGDTACESACAKPNESNECGPRYADCVTECAP